jgi:hypothetical protein
MSDVKKSKKTNVSKNPKLVQKVTASRGMKDLNFLAVQASSSDEHAEFYLYFKKHSSSRYFHLNPGISVVFQSISHHT